MNLTSPNIDFPPMTAAEMAYFLGCTPQAIRKQLRHSPATGSKAVAGNLADVWHASALPPALRSRLAGVASAKGFNSVGEMLRAIIQASETKFVYKPPIPLGEIADEVLTDAHRLMQALLPSLRRQFVVSQADFEAAGVADFEKIFGRQISTRHFRNLIQRTIDRDGGRQQWERVELYLPKKPARKPALPEVPPDFPRIAGAMAEVEGLQTCKGNRMVEISRQEMIYRAMFSTRAELMESGKLSADMVDRQIRDFVFGRMPSIAPSREAFAKTYRRKLAKHLRGEDFDRREENGSKSEFHAPEWFIPAARFFYLLSNRTEFSGSVPESLRYTISLPNLPGGWPEGLRRKFLAAIGQDELPIFPEELREEMLRRDRAGKPMVPRLIARQIAVNAAIVKHFRSPREWELNNLTAPGSQRRYFNKETSQREMMLPGDWFGGDDATPGIAVCVPCADIQTPTVQKFGVMLGRFQWLAYHDASTDKILAWDYVVRPRGSYRAEDILNGMSAVTRTHGVPRKGWQFEGGTWNSKLVRQAIKALDCEHWRTYSARSKSIESVFNRVWTRLAMEFPHADMGRFRDENEKNCKLFEACKAGHKDPRRYFPTLAQVVKVFTDIVAAHNGKTITSKQYGQWQPDEFFARATAEKPLRQFTPGMDWIFSPFAAERRVHGMFVRVRVPMFEGISVPFEFGADWLAQFADCKVRLHFNPRLPKCTAKIVLLEKFGQHKIGDVLGDAQLIGETAQHIRFVLGWGDDDQRAGFIAKQKAANFVRRETRGIGAAGRVEYSKSEERDGLGALGIVEKAPPIAAPAAPAAARRLAQNMDAEETTADRRAILETLTQETEHLFT